MKKGTQIGSWMSLFRAGVFILSANIFGFGWATLILALTFIDYRKVLHNINVVN